MILARAITLRVKTVASVLSYSLAVHEEELD
jgi:hypothetical protein